MRVDPDAPSLTVARQAATTADGLWSADGRAALTQLRLFGEALADAVGSAAGLRRDPGEEQLSFLNRLERRGLLRAEEARCFHQIRSIGNKAAHGERLSAEDASSARSAYRTLLAGAPAAAGAASRDLVFAGAPSSGAGGGRRAVAARPYDGATVRGADSQRTLRSIFAVGVLGVVAVTALLVLGPILSRAVEKANEPQPVQPPAPETQLLGGLTSYEVAAAEGTMVWAAPTRDGAGLFRLPTGAVVKGYISQDSADGQRWIGVSFDDGQKGWLPLSALRALSIVGEVEIGSGQSDQALIGYSEDPTFFGSTAPVAARFRWRHAHEHRSFVTVQVDPPVSGRECAWRLPTTTGAAICHLGEFPPGRYQIVISDADARPIVRAPFEVFETVGQPSPPSFDCSGARAWSERLVCRDAQLAEADVALSAAYQSLMQQNLSADSRSWLPQNQRQWLDQRDACRSAERPRECVLSEYAQRTAKLQEWTRSIAAQVAARAAQSPPASTSQYSQSSPSQSRDYRAPTGTAAPAYAATARPQYSYQYPSSTNPYARTSSTVGPQPRSDRRSWVRSTDYPERALRRRISGRSVVEWDVTSLGSVENCRVVQSSGDEDLDAAACRLITRRGSYWPARDSRGHQVRTSDSIAVTWIHPDAPSEVRTALNSRGDH